MSYLTRQEILDANGAVINNPDGTISVYTRNPSTNQLAPYVLTQISCTALGNAFFDTDKQKCRWSTENAGICNYNMPFNLVLNPKGNDGSIFIAEPNQRYTLGIEFDYMFKFEADTLTEFINGAVQTDCDSLTDIFESLGASVTLDVVKVEGSSVVLESIYEEKLFDVIGSGNLQTYLIATSGASGFYICGESPYSTGCTDLNLYDTQVNSVSTIKPFAQKILTSLSGVPSNSFASSWLNFKTEIADADVLSGITNEKIKLSIRLSGACIDICVLLDNIRLDRNVVKVLRNDIFLSKSPSFNLEKIIDNKKSWISNTETTHRTFNITKFDGSTPIRHTDYYLDDERQVINTKEIDLDINIASAIETDIWNFINDNQCILTGNTVGTTTCVKEAYTPVTGYTVVTAITSSTAVVTGTCCPVTAITASSVVYTSTTFSCPVGFSATPANDRCQRIENVDAISLGSGDTITAGDKNAGNYSLLGGYFYPTVESTAKLPYNYRTDGNLVDSIGTVITPLAINSTSSFWASLFSTANGRLNNVGIRAPLNSWAGFSQCIDIASGGTYYIGLAADNECRFFVNGTLVANFQDSLLTNFRKWSVFPIYLSSGLNFIQMQGMNTGQYSAFAAEVYQPISFSALTGATNTGSTGANVIFSTLDRIGTSFDYGDGLGYSCPSGDYILNTCGAPICTRILNKPIINTFSSQTVTTSGYCTDLGNPTCVTYTTTAATIVTTGTSLTNVFGMVNGCGPKTYCCSEYCGDEQIDIDGLLTQSLSSITTVEDFQYYINSELIDAKNRKIIPTYATLKLLYDRYKNSTGFCGTQSSKFDYYSINQFANLIGEYWVDLIEQVIPATTIWGSTKVLTNTIFDSQKYQYKSYSMLFGTPRFKYVTSPATGATCNTEAIVTVAMGSPMDEVRYSTVYAIQMNSGSEYIGTVHTSQENEIIRTCDINVNLTNVVEPTNGSNGQITANVTGAYGNVEYLWNTGASTRTIKNLSGGTYIVTVNDLGMSGCSATASLTFYETFVMEAYSLLGFTADTINSNAEFSIDWGDGTITPYGVGTNSNVIHHYTSPYTGNITLRMFDLSNIVSMSILPYGFSALSSNVIVIKTNQLSKLDNAVSLTLGVNVNLEPQQYLPLISGTLTDLPRSLQAFGSGSNNLTGNVSALPTGLTFTYIDGENTIFGDTSSFPRPTGVSYIAIGGNNIISGNTADLPQASSFTVLSVTGDNTISGNTADIPTGLTQCFILGDNTISGDIVDTPRNIDFSLSIGGNNTISGALSDVPINTQRLVIDGYNTLSGNVLDFTSNLLICEIGGDLVVGNTITGNIADLPSSVTSLSIRGKNTISGDIADLPSGMTKFEVSGNTTVTGNIVDLTDNIINLSVAGNNTLSGNLNTLPAGMATLLIAGNNTVTGNINTLPTGLISFSIAGENTVSGNLGDLPPLIKFLSIVGLNTISTYTSPHTWNNNVNMQSFTVGNYMGLYGFNSATIDNILIDLSKVAIWDYPNFKDINLIGTSTPKRTSASDAAVATLFSRGLVTLNIN